MKSNKKEKDSQARKYQLTINNPLETKLTNNDSMTTVPFTHEEIKNRLAQLRSVIYYCLSDEIGAEAQTPHTHIFLHSQSPIRFSTIKNKFPTAHIEAAYGSCQNNRDYITKSGKWADTEKSETSIVGTFEEYGTIPAHEKAGSGVVIQYIYELVENGYSDAEILRMYPEAMLHLDKIQRTRTTLLEDRFKNDWRDVSVTYIFGATNTGKTRSIMEKYGYSNVYRVTDYHHPWDAYRQQKVVLFEEFRSSLKIQDMLTYLDGYPCTLPARYANRQACFTEIFITTNVSLESQYTNVQEYEPETWRAFLRRIGKVLIYSADGSVSTYDSVKDYFARSAMRYENPLRLGDRVPFSQLFGSHPLISDAEFLNLIPTDTEDQDDG